MSRHRRSWSLSEKLEAVQLLKREGAEKLLDNLKFSVLLSTNGNKILINMEKKD